MTTKNTTPDTTPAATAAVAAPATTTETEQDFDAVFAAITTEPPKPADKPAAGADAVAAAGDADAGESVSPDAAVAAAEAAAAGADAPAAAVADAADAADAAAPSPELVAAQARIAELESAATAKPAADAKPAAAAEATTAEEAKPFAPTWYKPSDEEKAVLDAYEKEWPEVSAAESIRTKAAVWNAVQFMYGEVSKAYADRIARLESVAEVMETELTLSALRGTHKDYDDVREKVVSWVDTLPGPFKKAGKATLESGTPEDVSELIAEYKKANPTLLAAVPAAGTPTKPTAPASKTELSAAAKKAARTLGVVDSKRTTPAAAPSADDFDGAWAEATARGA